MTFCTFRLGARIHGRVLLSMFRVIPKARSVMPKARSVMPIQGHFMIQHPVITWSYLGDIPTHLQQDLSLDSLCSRTVVNDFCFIMIQSLKCITL